MFFAVLLLGLTMAAPAFAQGRDPFEPQPGDGQQDIDPAPDSERDPFDPEEGEPAAQDPDDPTEPADPVDPADPDPDPEPTTIVDPDGDGDPDSTLANTGFDVSTWGGIAYLLIVVGGVAILAARLFSPAVPRRRR